MVRETTTFRLASMTKLLTSIAPAQAIEQGLISLDTDVAPNLPRLAARPILAGFSPRTGAVEGADESI